MNNDEISRRISDCYYNLPPILQDRLYTDIKAALDAKDNKWISVDDEMPESGENVLCFPVDNETGAMEVACFDGFFYYADMEDSIFEGITHWQPLPQPPEGGE